MSDPKKHHFVPASYLAGFSEPDSRYLHVYDKKQRSFRKQLPNEVFHRHYYYRQPWAPDGTDPNIFEKTLGKEQESNGLNALRKLLCSPDALVEEEMVDILIYLNLQRIRVPRQASSAKSIYRSTLEEIIRQHPIGDDVLETFRVEVNDSFRFEYIRMMHDFFVPYFSRMLWRIVRAVDGSAFISSDSPVSLYNHRVIPPSEPGVGLYGTQVLFPIDKRHLLILIHPEFANGKKEADEMIQQEVKIANRSIEIQRGETWGAELVSRHNKVIFHLAAECIVAKNMSVLQNAIEP